MRKRYKKVFHESRGNILLGVLSALFVIGIIGFPLTQWLLLVNTQSNKLNSELEINYLILDEWNKVVNSDADKYFSKAGQTDSKSVDCGGNKYTVTMDFGNVGKYQNGTCTATNKIYANEIKCIPVDISIQGQNTYDKKTYKYSPVLLAYQSTNSYPIGSIMAWGVEQPIPEGYLICNGQTVDEVQYPDLYKLMTNVPDYRGMFLKGDETAGRTIEAGVPNITGSFMFEAWTYGFVSGYPTTGVFYTKYTSAFSHYESGIDPWNRATIFSSALSSSLYGHATTVQPSTKTVKWLIKAKY